MNYPWNHGKISRQAAEELLMKNATDGAYLVRESESVAGAHVLSLWYVYKLSLRVSAAFKFKCATSNLYRRKNV